MHPNGIGSQTARCCRYQPCNPAIPPPPRSVDSEGPPLPERPCLRKHRGRGCLARSHVTFLPICPPSLRQHRRGGGVGCGGGGVGVGGVGSRVLGICICVGGMYPDRWIRSRSWRSGGGGGRRRTPAGGTTTSPSSTTFSASSPRRYPLPLSPITAAATIANLCKCRGIKYNLDGEVLNVFLECIPYTFRGDRHDCHQYQPPLPESLRVDSTAFHAMKES